MDLTVDIGPLAPRLQRCNVLGVSAAGRALPEQILEYDFERIRQACYAPKTLLFDCGEAVIPIRPSADPEFGQRLGVV